MNIYTQNIDNLLMALFQKIKEINANNGSITYHVCEELEGYCVEISIRQHALCPEED